MFVHARYWIFLFIYCLFMLLLFTDNPFKGKCILLFITCTIFKSLFMFLDGSFFCLCLKTFCSTCYICIDVLDTSRRKFNLPFIMSTQIYEIGGGSGTCAKGIMDYILLNAPPRVYNNMTYVYVLDYTSM